MRLLRHGIFGRQTKSARSRKATKLAALLLIAASVVTLMAHVFAETERDLVRLTDGDIYGVSLKDGTLLTTPISRDEDIEVMLSFDPDAAYVGEFCNSVWTYDLSSIVGSDQIFQSINEGDSLVVTWGALRYDRPIGTYTLTNNKIAISLDQSWLECGQPSGPRTQMGELSLVLKAKLNPFGVGARDELTIELPGAAEPQYGPALEFDAGEAKLEAAVHDEGDGSWRSGLDQSVIVTKENNGTYTVNYGEIFSTNEFIRDMALKITLSDDENQTLVPNSFKLKKCSSEEYCATDDSATTIPSEYITYTDDKRATINLGEYFPNNRDEFELNAYYSVVYQASISDADLAGHTYNNYSAIDGTDEKHPTWRRFDESTLTYTAHEQIPTNKTGSFAYSSNNTYVDYDITVGDGAIDLSNLTVSDSYSNDQDLIGDITVCEIDTTNCSTITPAAKTEVDYTGDDIKLFDYTFPSNAGAKQYTISYRTKLALDAGLGKHHRVHNLFKKTIGNNEYIGGEFVDYADYALPEDASFITKKLVSQDDQNRTLIWEVTVNPIEGPMGAVQIDDKLRNWANIPTSEFATVVTKIEKSSDGTQLVLDTDYEAYEDTPGILTIYLNELTEKLTITLTTTFTNYAEQNNLKNVFVYNEATLRQDLDVVDYDGDGTDINPGNPDDNNKDGDIISFGYEIMDGGEVSSKDSTAIKWSVVVNPEFGEADPDEDVWFSDQLPTGVSLERYDSVAGANVTKLDSIVKSTRISPDEVITESCGVDTGIPVTVVSGMIQPIKISEITTDGLNCFTASPKLDGVSYVITYTTQIDDSILRDVSQITSLTNTAYIGSSANDANPRSASKTIDYIYPYAVEKHDTSSEVLEYRTINYSIDVNSKGVELNQGSPVVVTDAIGADVDLVASSVVLRDGDGVIISDRTEHIISYDSETRTLSVTIPDSEYCVISYSVRIKNAIPDQTIFADYTNTATVHGQIDFDSTVTKRHSVQNIEDGISGTIFIKKTERDNINAPVRNACFNLYEVANGAGTFIDSFCTGTDGVATIDGLSINKTYSWKEDYVPVAFDLGNTGNHYFTIYEDAGASASTTIANLNTAMSYAASAEQSNGLNAGDISVIPTSYLWPVTDERLREDSTLTVSKKLSGSIADYEKQFEFTVTLTDNSIAFTDQVFYQKGSNSGVFTPNSDGEITFTLGHDESIVLTSLAEGIDYEVEEADYSSEGYLTTTPANATGTLVAGNTDVLFANDKDYTEISTGIKLRNGALLAACVTFGVAFSILVINIALKIKKEVRA